MTSLAPFNLLIGKYYFVRDVPCQLLGLCNVYAGKMGLHKFIGYFMHMVCNVSFF